MEQLALHLLDGLSHASTLFLMASGLTLIFGITRIVNFAHGSFFMLGALVGAHALVNAWPAAAESAWGYLACMVAGVAVAALAGLVMEFALLRRLSRAPELYALVATFGLSLVMHDAMRWWFGPGEVFAPRFPGLKGALAVGSTYFPHWQLVMIALGPLSWAGLHLLLNRTAFGKRVRAATQDRDMLDALGVNPKPIIAAVVALACALAGLSGVLQLPREPAHLQMDVNVVVETFVVVVTGGLGSIAGAFWAAMLIGLIHAIGIAWFPKATLVLVFLTMAVVLLVRPQGLLGAGHDAPVRESEQIFRVASTNPRWIAIVLVAFGVGTALAWHGGAYLASLWADALILLLFGLSLQGMMALGGVVSFGHAAFFAVGAYAAALLHSTWGWGLLAVAVAGPLVAAALAAAFGAAAARRSGVYLAMLSLALAQALWALATQWVEWTGGDNGVIGLQLVPDAQRPIFLLGLALLAGVCVIGLAVLAQSVAGKAMQAARDAPLRAAASGIDAPRLRWMLIAAGGALAGLAGVLFAAHKGSVFPAVAAVSTSLDALLVVLLGGVHQLWGAAAGSAVLTWGAAELGRGFEYWRGLLGLLVMLIMVAAPEGLLSIGRGWRRAGR